MSKNLCKIQVHVLKFTWYKNKSHCYLGSHKIKGKALMLFIVAMRTAQFFITHWIIWMCYEIRGNHVTNSPTATIHAELLSADGCCYEHLIMSQLIVGLALHEGSADKDDLKKRRHRRPPVSCVKLGYPTTRPPTRPILPTTGTNPLGSLKLLWQHLKVPFVLWLS